LDAALLALEMRDPPKAAQYAQRLLSRFPQSPHRAEARLLLADAYADSGMYDDARTLYVRVANEAGAAHEMWSEALLRLGRLAMAQRNYRDAINNLQLRLERTLSADGNDETHLLLGQAYQQMGRTDDAHRILSDMLAFFPHSPRRVEAMITLSQVCDQQGRRQEALRVAQQAASEFPDSHRALENKAELLGLTGNPYGAATALTAADAAGAGNPALLLKAARYYKTAGALEDARATYTLLRQKYALSTDALTGSIELAVMMHNQGDTVEAARQLEELARATRGKPQHLQTLSAMADIYRDLGLRDVLRDTATEIAALATAPEMLARAGMDLVKAGDVAAAERLAARLDFARLRAQTAYTFLTRLGAALLEIDPARGLEKLEQAYLAYPESRAPKDAQPLLDAYLALDRSAQARRVVMDLAAQWRDEPRYIAPFVDAAIGWGDYLMRRGDYRTAAEAYHLAIEAGSANTEALRDAKRHPTWAKFQRANALMALSDYDRSLALYTEVSASNTPWADEARIKAEQARLELQLRSAAYAGAQRES
jgi:tetratricopeptide (TPR) repeat protein